MLLCCALVLILDTYAAGSSFIGGPLSIYCTGIPTYKSTLKIGIYIEI